MTCKIVPQNRGSFCLLRSVTVQIWLLYGLRCQTLRAHTELEQFLMSCWCAAASHRPIAWPTRLTTDRQQLQYPKMFEPDRKPSSQCDLMRLLLSCWNDTAWTQGWIVAVLIVRVMNNSICNQVAIGLTQRKQQNQQFANNFSIWRWLDYNQTPKLCRNQAANLFCTFLRDAESFTDQHILISHSPAGWRVQIRNVLVGETRKG